MILEFLPNDSECPFPHWKDGVGHVPRGQRDGVVWWIMCVLGPRGMWGVRGREHVQSSPRAASLHGFPFYLGIAVASGFQQAGYFASSPVEMDPAPLGVQDTIVPVPACLLLLFPHFESVLALLSAFGPDSHDEHALLTLLSVLVLCSRQGPEGCSAVVLVSMKASPCCFLWPASLVQIPLDRLSPCILSLVHSFLCLAVITGCCGFPLCLTLGRAGAPGELELLFPESVSLISRNFFLHS